MDEPIPYWGMLTHAIDASQTVITVDHGAFFQPGDLVKVIATDEIMRVARIVADTLTVRRGYIGPATAADENAYLLNMSRMSADEIAQL